MPVRSNKMPTPTTITRNYLDNEKREKNCDQREPHKSGLMYTPINLCTNAILKYASSKEATSESVNIRGMCRHFVHWFLFGLSNVPHRTHASHTWRIVRKLPRIIASRHMSGRPLYSFPFFLPTSWMKECSKSYLCAGGLLFVFWTSSSPLSKLHERATRARWWWSETFAFFVLVRAGCILEKSKLNFAKSTFQF